MPNLPRRVLFGIPIAAALLVASCGSDDENTTAADDTTAETGAPADGGNDDADTGDGDTDGDATDQCTPENLETFEAGTLTIATSEPAYEPWMVDNDPSNGQGYESAVAYAVAEHLGFGSDQVTWTRVDFNAAVQPGPKDFDFDINQFSITDERKTAVDFSSSYYDVAQAVITVEGSPAADAASLADLKDLKLGAQVGTTSLQVIENAIEPSSDPSVYNSNDDAKLALDNGQVDGLVVDLPTAFYMTAVEIENGVIVGQLPPIGEEIEQFGLVLDKDSPLTECVTQAVDALREDGVLAALEQEWLADVVDVPRLS
ncbi:ABC transporter substrate-binding protein [Phytoactinopolyspora halotolerans]|uniref:Amino acid ABC transporter substrate-binding protein n=1 Tax=Phytoactinopolyspora halotolerans TaxID=1981512 RepID=A0A6L9S2X3_9ACTN|nr:ABC transporter substrate-binding protein [Phytoactinopolyspora halotolerans]NED99398.1 amino acid ABC transporter substrate-binding protein [Phytoactinopolyspora halotolerans]